MQTLYRTLLRLLPRLGVQVLDLGPGEAVVSRRAARTRLAVGPGADLLARTGRRPYAVAPVAADQWLVSRPRGDAQPEAQGEAWKSVRLGDSGAQLLLDPRAEADERGVQLAAAEYLCGHHVAALLARYEVNCVFDVGANAGQYARRLRRDGYAGRIVSFEPTAAAFAKLEKAAEGDPDWWVYPFGLGRKDETKSIHTGWNTMNSLLSPSDYGRDRYLRFAKSQTEEIEIRRLDGVMDKALADIDDPRPYLKMDTQGYDLEVFAGAGERTQEFVGMQSEVALLRLYEGSPRMNESIAEYESHGFEVTGMYPVTREQSTGRVVEFDCVMVRASAVPE
ncbi:FkbM family methyltransferase [Streptomyces sp. NPDC005708]|uniref:FkbM family methyltransferase n=1 Tax=unclassified Streptomyces TaxID=2593676 RepID=UPI0033EF9182